MAAPHDPPSLEDLPVDPNSRRVNVVVDTPVGSRNKYRFDERHGQWMLSKVLPHGMSFPYDFGFIPSTLGDDGDPLDVLVLADESLPIGAVVPCRLIGVIEAEQQKQRKGAERNDRLIAVADASHRHRHVRTLRDLSDDLLDEIESFFVDDNRLHGRRFTPLARRGPTTARKLLKEGKRRHRER